MTGSNRLKEQIKDTDDPTLKEVVNYLISRDDLEQNYLKSDKTINEMCTFLNDKGGQYAKAGLNYIANEVVFAWAVMYYSLPNSFLKIKDSNSITAKKEENSTDNNTVKNNIISIETAKKKLDQMSLFGGAEDD